MFALNNSLYLHVCMFAYVAVTGFRNIVVIVTSSAVLRVTVLLNFAWVLCIWLSISLPNFYLALMVYVIIKNC
jgi:hypothetical protein